MSRKSKLCVKTDRGDEKLDNRPHLSRLQEKQLFADAAELGDRVNKALLRIAEECDPVDGAISSTDIYSPESRDIVGTALVTGNFPKQIYECVVSAIRLLTSENENGVQEILAHKKQTGSLPSSRELRREDSRRDLNVNRFLAKRQTALLNIIRAAEAQQRPLLASLVLEVANAAIADNMVKKIAEIQRDLPVIAESDSFTGNIRGNASVEKYLSYVVDQLRDDPEDSPRRRFFPWVVLAYNAAKDNRKIQKGSDELDQLHIDQVRQWLQTVDLQSTKGEPHVIPLPSIQFMGKELELRIYVPDDIHAFSIAGFDIKFMGESKDQALIAGEFSRLTADITTNRMWVYSPRRAMELFGMGALYDKIRFEVIKAVYLQYEKEQLPEEDRFALRQLLSEDPAAFQTQVAVSVSDTEVVEHFVAGKVVSEPETKAAPTIDSYGEMGTGRKRRLRETRERDLTYRMGVMAVKRRFLRLPGIRYSTKTGDHGHFYGPAGKVRFYNEHAAERMLTLNEIEEKLSALGYNLDQFWEV